MESVFTGVRAVSAQSITSQRCFQNDGVTGMGEVPWGKLSWQRRVSFLLQCFVCCVLGFTPFPLNVNSDGRICLHLRYRAGGPQIKSDQGTPLEQHVIFRIWNNFMILKYRFFLFSMTNKASVFFGVDHGDP
jgi:hypothetical protein